MLRGELQDALGFPDQALASYGEGLSVTALGQAQLAAGDLAAAHQQLDSALVLFHQLDIPGEITTTEQLLADVLSRRNSASRVKSIPPDA